MENKKELKIILRFLNLICINRCSFAVITAQMERDVFTGNLIKKMDMTDSIVIIIEVITTRLTEKDVLVIRN